MSDDQDGCEWVNVFFWYRPPRVVPAVKRLCVCVCVCMCVRACVKSTIDVDTDVDIVSLCVYVYVCLCLYVCLSMPGAVVQACCCNVTTVHCCFTGTVSILH